MKLNTEKILKYAKRAGLEVLAVATAAVRTMADPETPGKVKAMIGSALIYLVLPVDVLPDLLPGGFIDDLAVLTTALAAAGIVGKRHLDAVRNEMGLSS